MKETGAYRASYERSLSDPEGFWRDAAAGIAWIEPPTRVLDAVTDATKVPAQRSVEASAMALRATDVRTEGDGSVADLADH